MGEALAYRGLQAGSMDELRCREGRYLWEVLRGTSRGRTQPWLTVPFVTQAMILDEYRALPPKRTTHRVSCSEAAACTGLKVRLGPRPLPHAFILIQLTAFYQSAGGHRPTHITDEAAKFSGAQGSAPLEKEMATRLPVVWPGKIPWTQRSLAKAVHGVTERRTQLSACVELFTSDPVLEDKPSALQPPTGMGVTPHIC